MDHRKIGKYLGLFTFSNLVGSGLPLWKPKGVIIRKCIEYLLTNIHNKYGYEMVVTPHIGHKDLYKTSKHWDKYGENIFNTITYPNKGEEFILKPMNCPHHCVIYKSQHWSYRDLPKRLFEFGTIYRYEQSGELHGLTRVRSFTQDDAHIFCTQEQLKEELNSIISLFIYIFKFIGFNKYSVQISLRNNNDTKYMGTEVNWNKAEHAIYESIKIKGIKANIVYGEAAFYGPKLDFLITDAFGKSWQLGTIQVDYNLPVWFDLKYKNFNNLWSRPVIIHRATLGSIERFIAIIIEHTTGNFPFWIAPIQVIILTISNTHVIFAKQIIKLLANNFLRALLDDRNYNINKKIRDAENYKIPFIVILGDNEVHNEYISLRKHKKGNMGIFTLDYFVKSIKNKLIFKSYN
jgi:threonyl-tRNA synthetase